MKAPAAQAGTLPSGLATGNRRPYFLAAHFGSDVIASDATFIAEDPDGLMFALISSAMFMTWQSTVGGRLKSDLRFNKLLTWNTFPVPHLSSQQRRELILAGTQVRDIRRARPDASLAALYEPGRMPAELQAAHNNLDAILDGVYKLGPAPKLLERQDRLFDGYQLLTR